MGVALPRGKRFRDYGPRQIALHRKEDAAWLEAGGAKRREDRRVGRLRHDGDERIRFAVVSGGVVELVLTEVHERLRQDLLSTPIRMEKQHGMICAGAVAPRFALRPFVADETAVTEEQVNVPADVEIVPRLGDERADLVGRYLRTVFAGRRSRAVDQFGDSTRIKRGIVASNGERVVGLQRRTSSFAPIDRTRPRGAAQDDL